jgi:dihydroorotase
VLGATRGAAFADAIACGTGALVAGGVADLCVFDPKAYWTVSAAALRSQDKHTPFAGYELPGRVRCTLVAGAMAFEAGLG